MRLTAPGTAADARVSGENEWQVAGVEIARAGHAVLQVDVDRPGPAGLDCRALDRRRRPAADVSVRLAHAPRSADDDPGARAGRPGALRARGGTDAAPGRSPSSWPCWRFPGAALAADGGSESVIVRLRGAPAVTQPFGGTPSERGAAMARRLETDLGRRGRGLRAALAGRASAVRPLWIVGGFAVTAPRSVIEKIRARPDVASVTVDATGLRPAAEPGIDLVGAPPVWSHAGSGVLAGTRGAGVTVAVLDTGLDTAGPLGAAVPRRRARLARRVRPLRKSGRRRRILLRPRHRRRRGDRRRRRRCGAPLGVSRPKRS